MKRSHTRLAAAALICLASTGVLAEGALTLQADSAPNEEPWTAPATINYVHTNGSTTGSIDAALDYSYTLKNPDDGTFWGKKWMFDIGPYVHRNTDPSALKNDRGVSLSASWHGNVDKKVTEQRLALTVSGSAAWGKTLVVAADGNGNPTRSDDNTDRETLTADLYWHPAFPQGSLFFDAGLGLYSDHTSGGAADSDGRLSGTTGSIGANWAILGYEPVSVPGWSLAVVPTLTALAQVEKDSSASGGRAKGTYHLWSVAAGLAFASLAQGDHPHAIPSLSLSRSSGSDLLTGRPRSALTEITLGLTF